MAAIGVEGPSALPHPKAAAVFVLLLLGLAKRFITGS
jgi:hypothetical protein